jgi:beta-lactamase superfamily II metal-dependent hydrolase
MASPSLAILDVGHGNSAVLRDSDGVLVVDACLGGLLLDFLDQNGIVEVHAVVMSHADHDHMAGVLSLLLDSKIHVKNIYVNPDTRKTKLWHELRIALRIARRRTNTVIHTQLDTTVSGALNCGMVDVQILSPEPEDALGGVGGADLDGGTIHPHTLNAVIRLLKDGIAFALLPGDIDARGLEKLLQSGREAKSKILVFPHHGGHSGAHNAQEYVSRLCAVVQPEVVVFSIGRGKHDTPRPEIVEAVRSVAPDAHIACTQLSTHCAKTLPDKDASHLNDNPAQGKSTNSCCAGTILFAFDKAGISLSPAIVTCTSVSSRRPHRQLSVWARDPSLSCEARWSFGMAKESPGFAMADTPSTYVESSLVV